MASNISSVILRLEALKKKLTEDLVNKLLKEIEDEFDTIFTLKLSNVVMETDNSGFKHPAPREKFTDKFASEPFYEIDGNKMTVRWVGEEICFAEFGTGVFFNGSSVTLGDITVEMGTYGSGYGKHQAWSFKGEDGHWYWSRGTVAQHPFFDTVQEIKRRMPEIVRRAMND